MFRATKCVVQPCPRNPVLDSTLRECLILTYNAIEYCENHGITNRKGMKDFYKALKLESIPSCYKVASITRACAVIKSRKKSERRGIQIRHKKPLRPTVCITSGFFITAKGRLFVPLRREKYFDIQLNRDRDAHREGVEEPDHHSRFSLPLLFGRGEREANQDGLRR